MSKWEKRERDRQREYNRKALIKDISQCWTCNEWLCMLCIFIKYLKLFSKQMSLHWYQNIVSFHNSKFGKNIDLMATFSIDISTQPLSNVLLAVGFVISQKYYQLLFKEFSLNLAVFQLRRWRFIADAYFASQRRWVYTLRVYLVKSCALYIHTHLRWTQSTFT